MNLKILKKNTTYKFYDKNFKKNNPTNRNIFTSNTIISVSVP